MSKVGQFIQSFRSDGWQNILTGLGMQNRDKRMSSKPIVQLFTQPELEELYRSDDIAQKCVDKIPKEMFRTGYKIKVKQSQDGGQKIADYLKNINTDANYRKALKLARLHGGAAIILGVDDGRDASEPVDYNNIRSIKWLACVDRWRLVWDSVQWDLSKPNYGLPLRYRLQSLHAATPQANTIVHSDRVIRFEGIELPEQSFIMNNYWGDSILAPMYNALRNFNASHDGAASTLQDFVQTVYELENLADLIASGDDVLIQKRLALLDATRSIVKAIVIQKGENFRRDTSTITGMAELLTKVENRLVAATNMPHTVVLGEGSNGQTSGDSEKSDFYDLVAHEQTTMLMPKQLELLKLLSYAKDAPKFNFDDVTIEYNPLWEMTDAEKATVYKTNAEADAIYISNGVVDPMEVAQSRFGQDNGEIQIDLAARENAPIPQITEPVINKMDSLEPCFIQNIFLSKQTFQSIDKAAAWIAANNYSNAYPLETELAFEFKQNDISNFAHGSLIVQDFGEGIKAIVGKPLMETVQQTEEEIIALGNLIKASF